MRKYISIAVLFIFLFNIGGNYLWFSAAQYGIQQEIEKEIGDGSKDEDITLIIVAEKGEPGIAWIKPDKEFRFKGEMYDVVKIQIHDQKKYYYCLNDNKEKELIANFNKTSNTKKDSEKKLKQNFNYSLYLQRYPVTVNLYSINSTFPSIPVLYKSTFVDIHSPPPRLA